ncbi:MAG: coenzyme A pyrophosphatase [Desulfuromonadales bacterium C00003094]|jgi:8-oxo-dGTP pyrophosphatase MutT (NUDIX family)|nr:MAG: coenzyme A pyrophosphatase [Desulfuromonadales bacterium C00003094]
MLDPAAVQAALARHACRSIDPGVLRPAAVLLTFYPKDGSDTLLFTRRTEHLPDHAGEISFPGGRWQEGDADLTATALRETEEEMGVAPQDVTVLGQLDDFVSVYGYHVTPFVGTLPTAYPFRVDPREIAEVIEVPLEKLCDPKIYHTESWEHKGRLHPVGFFSIGQHPIWGLTAAVLRQFLQRIEAIDW